MSDRHYLIRVLGLSAIPRVVTFSLTSVSFPLMVRALGAEQYGIMVYLGSVASFLELFVSFGIGSAAGKGIALCRAERAHCLRNELRQWARFQFIVAIISLLPVLGLGYLFVAKTGTRDVAPILFLVVAVTVFVSIFVTFVRTVLNSLLEFKLAAVLDTIESIARSAGWLIIAWIFPTALGLALAGLATSLLTVLLAAGLFIWILARSGGLTRNVAARSDETFELRYKHMLKESWHFMGLTLGTRGFQTLPLILIGRTLGFNVVGIIGAFAKIIEILAFPFTVVGNALMVRAQEIKGRGKEIITRYWDSLFRFSVLASMVTAGFWFVVSDVARVILPNSSTASQAFSIMMVLILFRSVSDLFAPASDYVGGLERRLRFLLLTAVLQLPVIWVGILLFGEVGALVAMVGSYALMVIGYMAIAKRVFFVSGAYRPAKDIPLAFLVILISVGLALSMTSTTKTGIAIFALMLATGFLGIRSLRKQYASGRFLMFDLVQEPPSEVGIPVADKV